MTEEQIAKAFAGFIEGKGLRPESLSLSSFPQLFFDYYSDVRFGELAGEEDSDLLLFQYGIYNWGEGRFFELDFTRQYYQSFPEDESHSIYQQRFTFYFSPEHFVEVPAFNVWSNETDDLDRFQETITASAGFKAAMQYHPTKFETTIEDVC